MRKSLLYVCNTTCFFTVYSLSPFFLKIPLFVWSFHSTLQQKCEKFSVNNCCILIFFLLKKEFHFNYSKISRLFYRWLFPWDCVWQQKGIAWQKKLKTLKNGGRSFWSSKQELNRCFEHLKVNHFRLTLWCSTCV